MHELHNPFSLAFYVEKCGYVLNDTSSSLLARVETWLLTLRICSETVGPYTKKAIDTAEFTGAIENENCTTVGSSRLEKMLVQQVEVGGEFGVLVLAPPGNGKSHLLRCLQSAVPIYYENYMHALKASAQERVITSARQTDETIPEQNSRTDDVAKLCQVKLFDIRSLSAGHLTQEGRCEPTQIVLKLFDDVIECLTTRNCSSYCGIPSIGATATVKTVSSQIAQTKSVLLLLDNIDAINVDDATVDEVASVTGALEEGLHRLKVVLNNTNSSCFIFATATCETRNASNFTNVDEIPSIQWLLRLMGCNSGSVGR